MCPFILILFSLVFFSGEENRREVSNFSYLHSLRAVERGPLQPHLYCFLFPHLYSSECRSQIDSIRYKCEITFVYFPNRINLKTDTFCNFFSTSNSLCIAFDFHSVYFILISLILIVRIVTLI